MADFLRLSAADALPFVGPLARILVDAVEGGASVTFLPPLSLAAASEFWETMIRGAMGDPRWLLVLASADGQVVGCAMLAPAWQVNQRHRAEVAKVLVHRSARRQGIARRMMEILEQEAVARGFTLLTLDTCKGDDAENLYRTIGFEVAGTIPSFAVKPDGTMCDTVLFYKLLT